MIAAGVGKLGSGYTALVCGASELTCCGTRVGCRMLHNFLRFHGHPKRVHGRFGTPWIL